MATTSYGKITSLLACMLLLSSALAPAVEENPPANDTPENSQTEDKGATDKETADKKRSNEKSTNKSAFNCLHNLGKHTLSYRGAATIAFFVMFSRMVYKAEVEGGTAYIKRDLRWLNDNRNKALSKGYVKRIGSLLWNLVDNGLIGSPGKKRGIKAWGSKLVMDGDPEFGDTEIGPDGEALKFRRYGDKSPYGVMGTLWGIYIYPVIGHLKELKTLGEFISWTGGELGFDAA